MKFEQPLVEGKLIRRYNRFLAEVRLGNGEQITAHCANPGSMEGVAEPGSKVLLSVKRDSKTKFEHHLEIIYSGRIPVGIHTGRPISIIGEALCRGQIQELAGYANLRRQKRSKSKNRVDLILEGNSLRPCHIIVENVTMATEEACYFPDSRYAEGIDTGYHLTNLIREGNRAMIIFVAQRGDVNTLKFSDRIDGEYTQAFRDTVARGVEILAFKTKVNRKGIELSERLEISLNS